MTFKKYSTMAVAIGLVTVFAMPANAVPNKDQCIAEFAKINESREVRLESEEGKQFTEVASQVDVNGDGMISEDEYIVACTEEIVKPMN